MINFNFIAACSGNFFMFMTFYVYAVTLPLFVQESMKVSPEQMGLVTTMFMLASMLCRPFAGRWMDGRGRRRVIPISGALLVISTVSYFFADSYALLLILRLVNGAAFGIASTAIGVVVAQIVPADRQGEGMGYYSLSLSLAAVFGPFAGLFVYEHGSGSIVFAMCIIFGLLAFASGAVISLPERAVDDTERGRGKGGSFRLSTLFYAGTLPVAGVGILLAFAYSAVTNFIPAYSKAEGFGSYASSFFIVISLVMVIFRPLSGKLFDKYGAHLIIYPCIALFSSGLLLLFGAGSPAVFLTAGGIIGVGFGALLPAFQALAIQSAPARSKGAAMATYAVFHDFGYAAGSYVLGAAAAIAGFRPMYAADAVIVGCAAVVYYLLYHRPGHRRAEAASAVSKLGNSS